MGRPPRLCARAGHCLLYTSAFGAAVVTPSSVLGARLRALGGHTTQAPEKPTVRVRERMEQALDPISKAIPLSPADVSRTRAWLIQAGLREPRHVTFYFGARLLLAFVGLMGVVAFSGFDNLSMLVCVTAFGFFPVSYTHLDVYKRQASTSR